MRRTPRTIALLRTAVITAAAAAMVLGVSATAQAAWNDSAPLGTSSVTTGSLSIDTDAIAGGTWTRAGAAFNPASDKLTAGTTLTYTVTNVPVTAIGNNLEATFDQNVTGAQVPDAIKNHVTVSLTSDPTAIRGATSGSGAEAVTLKLTVAADATLPTGEQTISLNNLTVAVSNGHAWKDTATLNAGTLTAAAPPPAGGTVAFNFDLSLDDDRTICLYLTNPNATIGWGYWSGSSQVTTAASATGRYCHAYPSGSAEQPYVTVDGTFEGLGSPEQTVADIGALTGVNSWSDAIGTTSAAYAFYNAVNMTYIDGAPSSITDMSYMFANASTATTVDLSVNNLITANVTDMRHLFEGAGSINWWSILNASPQWDTANVVDMSGMFLNSTIGSYDLAFDTSSVRNMSSMFEGTTFNGNITTAGGRWSVSNVTNMAHMFDGAAAFNRDLSDWDTANVTTMQAMFQGATAFSQNLSGWNVAKVDNHGDFETGSSLTPGQLPLWNDASAAEQASSSDATKQAGDAADVSESGPTATPDTTPEAPTDEATAAPTEESPPSGTEESTGESTEGPTEDDAADETPVPATETEQPAARDQADDEVTDP